METRFFFAPNALEGCELPAEEAQHAVRVLRLKEGDEVMLMDGCGSYYRAIITLTSNHRCSYRIIESLPQQRQWTGRLHIAIAPTKLMERIEWMAEKSTEIGIDEVSFLNCTYSERRVIKTERIEKIIIAATKQSHKAWKPVVRGMEPFAAFIAEERAGLKVIAHCIDTIPRAYLPDVIKERAEEARQGVTVLIGPEGDFTSEEVSAAMAAGYVSVHLGPSRLRTETAALYALAMLHLGL